ncbi:MAG: putative peptidoglycan glycosyltransferase FtsW, partial [Pseudomonadota bacterium]
MDEEALESSYRLTKYFFITLGVLIFLGLIMVFSSSYIYAQEIHGSSYYFVVRQLAFLSVGILLAILVGRTKISFWIKHGHHINFAFTILLMVTLVPSLGFTAKGASRWISWHGINLQPGEFIKFGLILTSLYFFENFSQMERKELLKRLALLLLPLAILIKQPDFGTFTIGLLVIMFVCYMSSFPRKYFYLFISTGAIFTTTILFLQPYRVARILTFLDPWKNPKTSGFQIIQSYLAFANGSIVGEGLGNGHEKLFYLPEAHNDFIFSVIGEELGLIGVLFTICVVVLFLYLGFRLALIVNNRISLILISSVVFTLSFQSFFNMGVVLGLLPTKGLNLPFISYGG